MGAEVTQAEVVGDAQFKTIEGNVTTQHNWL